VGVLLVAGPSALLVVVVLLAIGMGGSGMGVLEPIFAIVLLLSDTLVLWLLIS
jgi:hypothetical protein